MLRSMFAGVSGLRNHQLKMDVIGNNIANVNTTGYKMSRVAFQEMYSQTLQGASSPGAALGGTNPRQVGLGVSTAAIDVIHEGGGAQTTDRGLDFCIEGEGFFVVKQGDNTYYTRAGNLYLDSEGYLVTANGLFVQGLGEQDVDPDDGKVDFDPATPDATTGLYDENDLNKIQIPKQHYQLIEIDKQGFITGIHNDGTRVEIGQISIATFVNQDGLTRAGNSMYQVSNNSGEPQYVNPGDEGSGTLLGSHLEMSNVDLSREFTDMIITQRGFQANSRVITVSDTLLEELINLKR